MLEEVDVDTIELGDINYFAVLVSVIIPMVLGALWYSPMLFAKQWMKASGFSPEKMKDKNAVTRGYIITIAGSILFAMAMAITAQRMGLDGAAAGIFLGLLGLVGFVAPAFASAFAFEQRPMSLYFIYVGYQLVNFVLVGLVIVLWK